MSIANLEGSDLDVRSLVVGASSLTEPSIQLLGNSGLSRVYDGVYNPVPGLPAVTAPADVTVNATSTANLVTGYALVASGIYRLNYWTNFDVNGVGVGDNSVINAFSSAGTLAGSCTYSVISQGIGSNVVSSVVNGNGTPGTPLESPLFATGGPSPDYFHYYTLTFQATAAGNMTVSRTTTLAGGTTDIAYYASVVEIARLA